MAMIGRAKPLIHLSEEFTLQYLLYRVMFSLGKGDKKSQIIYALQKGCRPSHFWFYKYFSLDKIDFS